MRKTLLLTLIWLSAILSAANLLPNFCLEHEINRNLGCYYLALHLLSLVILFLPAFEEARFRKCLALLLLALCGFYLVRLYALYVPVENPWASVCQKPGACVKLRTFFAHVPKTEDEQGALVQSITMESPDLLVLVDTPANLPAGLPTYPFQARTAQGLVLLSRRQIQGQGEFSLGQDVPGAIMAEVVIGKKRTLQISVIDTYPLRGDALQKNKLITRRILTPLKHNDREGVLFASLHATHFSNFYLPFVWAAKFENAANGFGLWHTWGGTSYFKRFAVDHVLVRGFVAVNRYEVLRLPGMAHMPVVVELETPLEVKSAWVMPEAE